jgi:hypothetical protein
MELWLLAMSLAYVDRTHRFYLQLGSCSNSTQRELAEQGRRLPTRTRSAAR